MKLVRNPMLEIGRIYISYLIGIFNALVPTNPKVNIKSQAVPS